LVLSVAGIHLIFNFCSAALFVSKINFMAHSIRVSRLPAPFVYKTMEAIEADRKPGALPQAPHRHDYYTIIVVAYASAGIHQIDFKNYPLASNTVFTISPGQIHHLNIPENMPVKGHVLMFTTDFLLKYSLPPERLSGLELFFNCDEAKPITLSETEMQVLDLFFGKFAAEAPHTNPDSAEILGSWLKLFLLELKRIKTGKALANPRLEHRQASIVRRFKDEVEQHFSLWHHVADYADSQNLSSNYLNEVVKSETGVSAKDFILNRLVLEAKRLAQYSDLSAKEVAFRLGYEDVAHFSKFFKKCTGMTFSEFKSMAF
jgi:AraC family transcriptional regulator, transcriptional activator of pobA